MKKFLTALMITALTGIASTTAVASPNAAIFSASQSEEVPDIIEDGNDGQAPTESQPSPGSGLLQLASGKSTATAKNGKFKVKLLCQTADGCMDAKLSIHGQVRKKQYKFSFKVPETEQGITVITVKLPASITKAVKKNKTKSIKFTIFGPSGFAPGFLTVKTS